MARIRTIKPEFFTSEDIVSLSPLSRLLYIACWCESDREGRFEWRPGTLKLRYFPGDQCDIDALASELLQRGLVVVYEVDRREYAEIPSFERHQIINNRESESRIPPRVRHASATRESGVLGEGKEGRSTARVASQADAPPTAAEGEGSPVALLPLVDGSEYRVSPARAAEWAKAFPAVNVPQALQAMRVWLGANPSNRKTRNGVERFVVNWLSKEQNRAPRAGPAAGRSVDGGGKLKVAI
jgi:hypothetical protein